MTSEPTHVTAEMEIVVVEGNHVYRWVVSREEFSAVEKLLDAPLGQSTVSDVDAAVREVRR